MSIYDRAFCESVTGFEEPSRRAERAAKLATKRAGKLKKISADPAAMAPDYPWEPTKVGKKARSASDSMGRASRVAQARKKQAAAAIKGTAEKVSAGRLSSRDPMPSKMEKRIRKRITKKYSSMKESSLVTLYDRVFLTEDETKTQYWRRMKKAQGSIDPKNQPILHKLLGPRHAELKI